MSTRQNRISKTIGLGILALTITVHASASGIQVDGTTTVSADTIGDFLMTGSVNSLDPFLYASNDVGLAPVEVCYAGTPCSVAESLNADSGNSGATYSGRTATSLFGLLKISGPSFSIADATPGAPYQHLATISVDGLLLGEDNNGRTLFEVNVLGTGHLTLDGSASADGKTVHFASALTNFSGTVTPTPEPSTFALLSLCPALLIYSVKRRNRVTSR